eukprot:1352170-Rhodomonas_salina.1
MVPLSISFSLPTLATSWRAALLVPHILFGTPVFSCSRRASSPTRQFFSDVASVSFHSRPGQRL